MRRRRTVRIGPTFCAVGAGVGFVSGFAFGGAALGWSFFGAAAGGVVAFGGSFAFAFSGAFGAGGAAGFAGAAGLVAAGFGGCAAGLDCCWARSPAKTSSVNMGEYLRQSRVTETLGLPRDHEHCRWSRDTPKKRFTVPTNHRWKRALLSQWRETITIRGRVGGLVKMAQNWRPRRAWICSVVCESCVMVPSKGATTNTFGRRSWSFARSGRTPFATSVEGVRCGEAFLVHGSWRVQLMGRLDADERERA